MTDHREPFFSIIVASFNAGDRLKKTLQNILQQTCGDYEILVKDGLSGDGSLRELPDDPRIRIFSRRDGGIYDGMNQALPEAHGKYVYFLNCGDYLYRENVLEEVKAAAEAREAAGKRGDADDRARKQPQQYVFYGSIYERLTGQTVAANPVMDDFACYRNLPCHQACFYSAGLFRSRGFDTDLKVRADYEHFLYCRYRAHAELVCLPLTVADYEGGGYSETADNRKISAAEHRVVTALYMPAAERLLFRAYMILTLQPLREKFARGKHTAALYDRIKNGIYGKR